MNVPANQRGEAASVTALRRIVLGVAIFAIVGVVALVVVGAVASTLPSGPSQLEPVQPAAAWGDSGTSITSVVLRNGVPCAVMDGSESKALACDWTRPRSQTNVDPRGDRGTTITLVTLADGTMCAVMDGKPGKALSCEGRT